MGNILQLKPSPINAGIKAVTHSVNDISLERDMRGIFYMLEDADLLYSHREETTFYDGKRWTLFFWTLYVA